MNTKKIWILAILFGLIMSFLFFILTFDDENDVVTEPAPTEDAALEEETEAPVDVLGIEPGKRAMTIPVDEIQSVTGFVQPGSYIDVVSILDDGVAKIILQNKRVLAVGKTTGNTVVEEGNEQPSFDKITLELDPNEGPLLSLARARGIIALMLRAEEDEADIPAVTISLEQLIKEETAK